LVVIYVGWNRCDRRGIFGVLQRTTADCPRMLSAALHGVRGGICRSCRGRG